MNFLDFTESQRQSIIDLALLAMYSDAHLASTEDNRIQQLLRSMGFETDYDCNKQLDAAVTRIRQHKRSSAPHEDLIEQLTKQFTNREHQRRIVDLLEDLMASDSQVAPTERQFLLDVKQAFGV